MLSNADIEAGAGNSFLGGLAAGMIISGDMYEGWPSLFPVEEKLMKISPFG